jgi:hypothetical protein
LHGEIEERKIYNDMEIALDLRLSMYSEREESAELRLCKRSLQRIERTNGSGNEEAEKINNE